METFFDLSFVTLLICFCSPIVSGLGVGVISVGPSEICQLPVDSGSASQTSGKEELRYYYSSINLKCTEFPYLGDGGNGNNFKTLEDCKRKCMQKNVGELPLVKSIIAAQAQRKCFYGNRTYAIRESISQATRDSPCSMGCFCSSYRAGHPPSITCASVDCAPYPDSDGERDCVPTHKEGVCCPEYYCPSASSEQAGQPKPFTCNYNGQEYVEGQTIYPDDYPCITCSCNQNFKGFLTTEGGVCKEVNCGIQIHHQHNLVDRCIPKFYTTSTGKVSCCPIEWNCEHENNKA